MWQPFGSQSPPTVQLPQAEPVPIRSPLKKLVLLKDSRLTADALEKEVILYFTKHLYTHDWSSITSKRDFFEFIQADESVDGDCLIVHVSVAPNGIQRMGEIHLEEKVTADELRSSLLGAPSGLTILLFINGHFPPLLRYRHTFRGEEHDVNEDVTVEDTDSDIWVFSGPGASSYFLQVAGSKGLLLKARQYCGPTCTIETGRLTSQPNQILAKLLGAPLF